MLVQDEFGFSSYAQNLNRVQLVEFLDYHRHNLRWAQLRPSLIHNPLTGLPYQASASHAPAKIKAANG